MIAAQQYFIKHEDLRPELAAASTLAAAEQIKERLPADASLVLLICGCNDSAEGCGGLRRAAASRPALSCRDGDTVRACRSRAARSNATPRAASARNDCG